MSATMTATRSSPVTPAGSKTVVSDSPAGNWQHPRFDEIHQRLNQSTFDERNARSIAWNLLFLFVTFFVPSASSIFPALTDADITHPSVNYATSALRLLLLWNVAVACLPLIRTKDDLSDIPLTPSQRSLLGLQPASRPASEGSVFITPPKYSRSPTPSGAGRRSLSGSPYSDSAPGNSFGGTPYSPSASPLFHKAMGKDSTRRLSLGTPSSLGLSKSGDLASTPLLSTRSSPATARTPSVTLNTKWLYETGRFNS